MAALRRTSLLLYPFGTVKSWKHARGFGFITPDDGQDLPEYLFVARQSLLNRGFFLDEGQRVTFKQHSKDGSNRAVDVEGEDFTIPVERNGKVISSDEEEVKIELHDGRVVRAVTAEDWDARHLPEVGNRVLFALQGRDRAVRVIHDPRTLRSGPEGKSSVEKSRSVLYKLTGVVDSLGATYGFVKGIHPVSNKETTVYFSSKLWKGSDDYPLQVGAKVRVDVEETDRGPRAYSLSLIRKMAMPADSD